MDSTDLYLWVGVVGIIVHFLIVGAVYFLASSQGRNALGWAGIAMLTGPLALIAMFMWRGDPRSRQQPGRP